jgi:hypothetical protein
MDVALERVGGGVLVGLGFRGETWAEASIGSGASSTGESTFDVPSDELKGGRDDCEGAGWGGGAGVTSFGGGGGGSCGDE